MIQGESEHLSQEQIEPYDLVLVLVLGVIKYLAWLLHYRLIEVHSPWEMKEITPLNLIYSATYSSFQCWIGNLMEYVLANDWRRPRNAENMLGKSLENQSRGSLKRQWCTETKDFGLARKVR